jgi:hypothetical protein
VLWLNLPRTKGQDGVMPKGLRNRAKKKVKKSNPERF